MLESAYVYILASRTRRLYIGVTRDLCRRWHLHAAGRGSKFAAKYRILRLVYFERTVRLVDALAREKQLKGWRRTKKLELIEASNPSWIDYAKEWGWTATEPSVSVLPPTMGGAAGDPE